MGAFYNEVRPYDFRSSRAPRPHRGRIPERAARGRRLWRWRGARRWQPESQRARRRPDQAGPDRALAGQGRHGERAEAGQAVQRPAPGRQGHLQGAARQSRPAAAADDPEHPDQEPGHGRSSAWTWCGPPSSRPRATSMELPADQFPTDEFLPATVNSATYFNKLYAYPSDLRRRPALLPQGPAGQVQPAAADHLRRDEGGLRQDPGRRERRQAGVLRRSVQQVRGSHGELRRGGHTAPAASSSATTASRT